MKRKIEKHGKLLAVLFTLLLLSIGCFVAYKVISVSLDSQKAGQRWQGDGEMQFAQTSVFMPTDQALTLEQIINFRKDMDTKFHEAALDIDSEGKLFNDGWCTFDKVPVSSDRGKGEVAAIAVGGSFFDFHRLKLLSGSYLSPDDLMKDRVILDEETAWLLFGGTDLQGMSFKINGVPFVVAGVVERENDAFSKRAYTSGMGIFMSYDAYAILNEDAGISCYEVVMPQPVKGFTYSVVSEKFPVGQGVIVDNSGRYDFFVLMKMALHFGERSIQNKAVAYPYWENAARLSEDWCAALLSLMTVLALFPVGFALVTLIRALVHGKEKLEDEVAPSFKEKAQEAIRVRQRRHWEKRHGVQPEEDKPKEDK